MLVEMTAFERLTSPAPDPKEREAVVDKFLAYPRQAVEDYFQLFYRGFSAVDLTQAMEGE